MASNFLIPKINSQHVICNPQLADIKLSLTLVSMVHLSAMLPVTRGHPRNSTDYYITFDTVRINVHGKGNRIALFR